MKRSSVLDCEQSNSKEGVIKMKDESFEIKIDAHPKNKAS